jgi:CMP-N,N'-diacetyllegionaminic acid synthase
MAYRGRPLIAHSINAALGAASVERTVVSTEDPQIADVARACGAEVVERPIELAGDAATSESALIHVLDTLEARDSYVPELVTFLQATSPERAPSDIDNAVGRLLEDGADSLLSVCRFERYVWREVDGRIEPLNYDYRRRWRDQDFPTQYLENGSIYVFRPAVLREQENRLGGRIAVYVMAPERSFQIDEPRDLAGRSPW